MDEYGSVDGNLHRNPRDTSKAFPHCYLSNQWNLGSPNHPPPGHTGR